MSTPKNMVYMWCPLPPPRYTVVVSRHSLNMNQRNATQRNEIYYNAKRNEMNTTKRNELY
jgi:hypothetical protein